MKAGQPLMEIYSSAVASAAADYLTAIDSDYGGRLKGAGRTTAENLAVPEQVISEIDKSHVAPVPCSGRRRTTAIVLERNAIEGMRANPGDVLFRIADIAGLGFGGRGRT